MKEIREISNSWEERVFDKDEQTDFLHTFELNQDGDALHYIHTILNQTNNERCETEKFGLIVLRMNLLIAVKFVGRMALTVCSIY